MAPNDGSGVRVGRKAAQEGDQLMGRFSPGGSAQMGHSPHKDRPPDHHNGLSPRTTRRSAHHHPSLRRRRVQTLDRKRAGDDAVDRRSKLARATSPEINGMAHLNGCVNGETAQLIHRLNGLAEGERRNQIRSNGVVKEGLQNGINGINGIKVINGVKGRVNGALRLNGLRVRNTSGEERRDERRKTELNANNNVVESINSSQSSSPSLRITLPPHTCSHPHKQTDHTHKTSDHALKNSNHAHKLSDHAHKTPNNAHKPTDHAHKTPNNAHKPTEHSLKNSNHAHKLTEHAHKTQNHAHIPNHAHKSNHTHSPPKHAHKISNHAHIHPNHAHKPTDNTLKSSEHAHIPAKYTHKHLDHAHSTNNTHTHSDHAHTLSHAHKTPSNALKASSHAHSANKRTTQGHQTQDLNWSCDVGVKPPLSPRGIQQPPLSPTSARCSAKASPTPAPGSSSAPSKSRSSSVGSSAPSSGTSTPTPTVRFPAPKKKEPCDVCRWKECNVTLDPTTSLLEHIQAVHVEGQLEAESFRCLWVGCKVYDKASCSVSWLERHVLTHGGHKPFKCIVDGCGQRFTSQTALGRHVNHHFSSTSTTPSPRPPTQPSPTKIIRKNGRKCRYKKKPWSAARMFDMFDVGVMECLRWRLLCVTNVQNSDEPVAAAQTFSLDPQILARRTCSKGNIEVFVRWSPSGIVADDWVPLDEVESMRKVALERLSDEAKQTVSQLCYPNRPRPHKHRRKRPSCPKSLSLELNKPV